MARITQSLALLATIALIAILPGFSFMPQFISYHDGLRLLELLILALVLVSCIIGGTFDVRPLLPNKLAGFSTFLILALGSLSAFYAKSPRHAAIEVSVFAGLFYLALFIANICFCNKERFAKQVSLVCWAGILVYMVAFYTGYISSYVINTPLLWPLPFTGFDNIRSFNQYQCWSLGLLSFHLLAFDFKKVSTTRWLHLALALWWVLLFYSASRGVLLAWAVGVLLTAIVYQQNAWAFLRLQLTNMGLGLACYLILFKWLPALFNLTPIITTVMRSTTGDRIELWNQALILIRQFPLLGAGPMQYPWYNPTLGHPHNSVLQLAAEWGLPATILVLLLSSYGLYCWIKKFNAKTIDTKTPLDKHWVIILFFTIITNAAYSLVDGVIVMPISQVMMFILLGLMMGYYGNDNTGVIKTKSRLSQGLALVILATMLWASMPEVIQGLSGSEKGFSMGYRAVGPRFWIEVTRE